MKVFTLILIITVSYEANALAYTAGAAGATYGGMASGPVVSGNAGGRSQTLMFRTSSQTSDGRSPASTQTRDTTSNPSDPNGRKHGIRTFLSH